MGGGDGEAEGEGLAAGGVELAQGGLAEDLRLVGVGGHEADLLRDQLVREAGGYRKVEEVAEVDVVGPLVVAAEIFDAGFHFDDDDLPAGLERDHVGAPTRAQSELRQAGIAEFGQMTADAAGQEARVRQPAGEPAFRRIDVIVVRLRRADLAGDTTLHARSSAASESILDRIDGSGAGPRAKTGAALPDLLTLHDRLARRLAAVAQAGGEAAVACTLDAEAAPDESDGIIGRWGSRLFRYAEGSGIESMPVATGAVGATGLARYPLHGLDPAQLIRAAERAARDADKGQLLEARARRNHRLPPPEPAALAEGRVMLHYQPQVGLADERIHGLEALMRIQSRPDGNDHENGDGHEGGTGAADHWVSGATTAAQLSEELLRWTFQRARADLDGWAAEGLEPVWVTVNLPLAAFADDRLTELIVALATEEPERAGRFEIELTEDQPPGDLEAIARNLARLRDSGPRVALDDIGTGFAGISLLDRLPLDALKIDRTFVAGLPASEESRGIVQCLAVLGHERGLTVIGEGVESPEQRAALAELGCDLYQGYVFSPPVSAEAVARLLRA